MPKLSRPDPEMLALLKRTASSNKTEAFAAQREFTEALRIELEKDYGLEGDNTGIFTTLQVEPNSIARYPLSIFVPNESQDFIGYTIPGHGYIPQRMIEGANVEIGTYKIASAIDWLLDFAASANYPVIQGALAIFESSMVRKKNVDAWKTLLASAAARGLVVYDSLAPRNYFSKRLMTLMQLTMRRQGGYNSTTAINQYKMTDLYVSPEGLEGMRNWDLTVIDDVTRREIFLSTQTGGLTNLYGVTLHELLELGEGQVYQNFLAGLGVTLGTNDVNQDNVNEASDAQFVVGIDQTDDNTFLHPVRQPLQIFDDSENLHRQQRAGFYGWEESGWGVLNSKRLLLGSF